MNIGGAEQALAEQVFAVTKALEEQVEGEIDKFSKLDSDDLDKIRAERREQMKLKAQNIAEWKTQGHGEYSEIGAEKDFFDVSKKSTRVVCHFYRESTFRCKIVDKHLSLLAPAHLETKFCKIDVEKCPFLVDRLGIKVLPAIILMKDAIIISRIVGFQDLGNRDDFRTDMLEWRLGVSDIIEYNGDKNTPPDQNPAKKSMKVLKKTIRGGTNKADSESEPDSDSEPEPDLYAT